MSINRLSNFGYYRFASREQAQAAQREALISGDLYVDDTCRVFFADAENIYESGAREFLVEIYQFLRLIGSPILSFEEVAEQGSFYDIVLNGSRFRILSKKDNELGDPWRAPTMRLFCAINSIIGRSPAQERLYYDVIGNDTMTVFLSDDMYSTIVDSGYAPQLKKPR